MNSAMMASSNEILNAKNAPAGRFPADAFNSWPSGKAAQRYAAIGGVASQSQKTAIKPPVAAVGHQNQGDMEQASLP